jgi:hypothetical protein
LVRRLEEKRSLGISRGRWADKTKNYLPKLFRGWPVFIWLRIGAGG